MPIYEYRCENCGGQISLQRPMEEASAPAPCPNCGAAEMTRLISRIHVVKSDVDRSRDVSWIDRDVANRLRRKSGGRLSPGFKDTLDRMESD